MTSPYPMAPLGTAIHQQKAFIEINDFDEYKRCRVQLHAKGVILRDTVPGSEIKTKKQQVCKAAQLLVAEIDAKVGGFGIVPSDLDGAIVSSHYFLFDLNRSILDERYLDFFIRTPGFRDQVQAQGSTNYAAIRPNHVLEYLIPLPHLEEQRRIVARIEELAAKIEEARKLRREAVDQAASLVMSLHLELAHSRTIFLSDVLIMDEHRVPILFGDEYPQVGVKGFGGGLFPRETLTADQTTYKEFNLLYEGALVLSQVKGWEGAVAVCPQDLAGYFASPEYRTFRCIEGMALPEYLAALVVTPWFYRKLKDITRGVGARRERIRPEQFLQLQLPMPTADKQKQALPIFNKLTALKPYQSETSAELDAMLPSILDKAFNGEL